VGRFCEVSLLRAIVRGVGSYLPARSVSNDELPKNLDTSDEWIRSHTGIGHRHIAAAGEKASDMGLEAARRALQASGLAPSDLGLILVATSTADYQGFPSTASIIQDRLGAASAGAMDVAAACTGYVYALATAAAFLESGAVRNALVIGSEVMTRVLDWTDRLTCVLFGDGAGAVVLAADDSGGTRGILGSVLRSDGSGADALKIAPRDGQHDGTVQMDGRPVYNFAVRVITELVEEVCSRHGIAVTDLRAIVPHQANVRIVAAAAKRLGVPIDLFYLNMERVANTSAASIPIALAEIVPVLKPGDLVLTLGFGGGLTWGANLIRW
jgi:3-oxoacyl-[acyl-carrier-protein] synthase III